MAKTKPRTTAARSRQIWRPKRAPEAPPPSRGAKVAALVKGKSGSLGGRLAVTAATVVGGAVLRKVKARRATKDVQALSERTSMTTAPSSQAAPSVPTMPDGARYGTVDD